MSEQTSYKFDQNLSYFCQISSESCGLFYEQYSQKIKMEAEPDIMEDFRSAAMDGRIGGKY